MTTAQEPLATATAVTNIKFDRLAHPQLQAQVAKYVADPAVTKATWSKLPNGDYRLEVTRVLVKELET